MMHRLRMSLLLTALACMRLLSASEPDGAVPQPIPATIDFNRDVRPILSSICYNCHGPDKESRKAKLRLDTREGAMADLDGNRAIVPGSLEKSELYKRIITKDPEEIMPPPKAHHTLTPREIAVLKKWIEQGAPYAEHWSFTKPVRPELPAVKTANWSRNGIDRFILARLEKEGLTPSAEADRRVLIRRVSLDLTGLPPTPQQVDDFVNDKSANAYEKVVDRLLASPAYGERWARMWLDLARYADSAGYGSDPLRLNIWPFRDWVISAFNRNLPYDQFTIEQIAGDLLPNATTDQILATAFHRNTMTNTEGGTDDEEFRVAAIKDRANTTAQVWMGLTMGCAQCHSHKFDPISNTEYYQFYAFFNQTEDSDRGDEFPTMPIPTPTQKEQSDKLKAQVAEKEAQMKSQTPEFNSELAEWEKLQSKQPINWEVLEPTELKSANGVTLTKQPDNSILASGKMPETDTYTVNVKTNLKDITAVRLELLTHDSLPSQGPGHSPNGNIVLNNISAKVTNVKPAPLRGRYIRVEIPGKQKLLSLAEVQVFSGGQNIAVKGKATQSSVDYEGPPNLAIDGNTNGDYNAAKSTTHTKTEDNPWWEVDLGAVADLEQIEIWNRTDGGTHTRLMQFSVKVLDGDRKSTFEKKYNDPPNPNLKIELTGARPVMLQHATADYSQDNFQVEKAIDGDDKKKESGWAVGGQIGKAHTAVFELSTNVGGDGTIITFTLNQNYPQHLIGRFRFSATTRARPVRILPDSIAQILTVSADKRSDKQKEELAEYYRPFAKSLAKVRDELAKLNTQLTNVKPPSAPIMRELPANKRRTTKILAKGNFLAPGEPVQAGVPVKFNAMPNGASMDRLGLAKWLVDRDNPLTARVAVNRFWAQLFGTGLVETEEDFGTQGTLPSHPELLDWMAVEFMDQKWDMKAFLKLLVTSATYQQSSKATPQLLEKDPRNRLLARSPRRRLEAEMVRDQALAISGLLSKKIGGPSVFPPQPDGLWRAAFNGERTWSTSTGEDKYRRGLYTFWRRTVPYPSMATFDAPSREICSIRRISTNTPLQAFVTMNDPVYVEASQSLARRLVKEGGASTEERAKYGLKLALCCDPQPEQIKSLVDLYESELKHYKADAAGAQKMAAVPLGPVPAGMDTAELAAWTVVGNVLLNLDGVLMKN